MLLLRSWIMYFPVSGNVSCCWLFALKAPGLTTAPVGENTVAVAVRSEERRVGKDGSVTRSPACPEKVSWSTLAALSIRRFEARLPHVRATSTGLVVGNRHSRPRL